MNRLLLKLLSTLGDNAEKELIGQLLQQIQYLKAENDVLRSKLPEKNHRDSGGT
jgi:hypothetical protein